MMKEILGGMVMGLLAMSCASTRIPRGHIVTDMNEAQCKLFRGPDGDAQAPGFTTFICMTSDQADAPHIIAKRMHSPALFVRVPNDAADAFLAAHPVTGHAQPSSSHTGMDL